MLASMFVTGGLDAVRHPDSKTEAADPVVSLLQERLPKSYDTRRVVQADGAVKVLAGTMLAFGKFPRVASLVLAASLVPTTVAGHPFWSESDPGKRRQQQVNFTKNLSMLGGLLLASVDTAGKPSLAWRAKRTPDARRHATAGIARETGLAAKAATSTVREKLPV